MTVTLTKRQAEWLQRLVREYINHESNDSMPSMIAPEVLEAISKQLNEEKTLAS